MTQDVFTMTISRSNHLLIYFILVHSMMLLTLVTVFRTLSAIIISCVIITLSFLYYCQQHQWLRGSKAIVSIGRDEHDKWSLHYQSGIQIKLLRLKSSVVISQCVMLNFQDENGNNRPSITIMADSVDEETFRRLRKK